MMNGKVAKILNTKFEYIIFNMRRFPSLLIILFYSCFCYAQSKEATLKILVDSLRIAGNFPGLSVAVYSDQKNYSYTSGFADPDKQIPLKTSDRLLQGSVGKTYAAAITLKLIKDGKINLDEKVSKYLGHHGWYGRIPNAADITVRMIMNHTSGVMRYEFKDQFTRDLTANHNKTWKPEDLLQYILDEEASFPAGTGWEYSDTNFILLGMIIEQITGKKFYDLAKRELLQPFKLENTFPSDSRKLTGLVLGFAGEQNEFGGKDRVIGDDGLFIINPQFEWTGGGFYSSTEDLAKWGKSLYEGKVVDTSLMLHSAVPAKLGRDVKYGLGVIIRQTPIGVAYGHSGFFPGYLTEMYYFPQYKMCVAVQANSSDFKKLKGSVLRCLVEVARLVMQE